MYRSLAAINMCLLTLCGILCNEASAQDAIESIRQWGPDPKLIAPEGIETGYQMMQWQAKLQDAQMEQIRELKAKWSAEQMKLESQLQEYRNERTAFLSRTALENLASRKIDLDVEVTGLQSKMDVLKEFIDKSVEQNQRKRSDLAEEALLEKSLNIRKQSMVEAQKLLEKGLISKLEVAQAEADVIAEELNLERVRERMGEESGRVDDLRGDLTTLTLHLTDLSNQQQHVIEQLKSSSDLVVASEKLQSRLQFARLMVEKCDTELLELELQSARSTALMRLTKEALDAIGAEKNEK